MNRDSGSEQPGQRTVAELLAEYGGDSSGKTGTRRRRRRAEDPTETAPHAIIDRVLSDSGTMRPVDANGHPVSPNSESGSAPAAQQPAPQQPPAAQPPTAAQQPQQAATQHQPQPAAPQQPDQQPGPDQQPNPQQPAQPQSAQPPGTAQPAEPQQPPQPPRAQAPSAPAPQPPAPSGPPPPTPNTAAPGRQPEPPAQPEAAGAASANDASAAPAPSANVWAQRFEAAAGGAKQATARTSAPANPDQEQTSRQAPVHPNTAQPGQQDSGHTQQIPPVDAADQEGTAVVPVPQNDPYAAGGDLPRAAEQDPYDPYGGQAPDQSFGAAPAYDDSYAGADGHSEVDDYADEYAQDYDEFDEYAHDRPAGMGADHHGDDHGDDHEEAASPGREWATFVAQTGACLVGGGLLWLGFRWLWVAIPVAALVAALVVTGALVLVARKVVRGDDLQTVLLAVLVGLVCTVSPAALLLIGQ